MVPHGALYYPDGGRSHIVGGSGIGLLRVQQMTFPFAILNVRLREELRQG